MLTGAPMLYIHLFHLCSSVMLLAYTYKVDVLLCSCVLLPFEKIFYITRYSPVYIFCVLVWLMVRQQVNSLYAFPLQICILFLSQIKKGILS